MPTIWEARLESTSRTPFVSSGSWVAGGDLLLGDDSELDGSLRGAFNLPGKLTADVVAYEIKSSKGQIFDARPHVEYLIKCACAIEGSSGEDS